MITANVLSFEGRRVMNIYLGNKQDDPIAVSPYDRIQIAYREPTEGHRPKLIMRVLNNISEDESENRYKVSIYVCDRLYVDERVQERVMTTAELMQNKDVSSRIYTMKVDESAIRKKILDSDM